jgi:O-antigen/teichoic acid export membrane protein
MLSPHPSPPPDALKPPTPSEALRLKLARLPVPVRATILFGLGIAWSRGAGLLLVPVMTASLSPAAFGRLDLLASAAEICGLMIGAGLVDTLFRFAGRPGAAGRRAAADVVGLSLSLGLAGLVLLALFGSVMARAMPLPTPPVDIWLLGVQIVMDALIGVALGWLRMKGRAGRHALASGLRATLQAGLIGILLMQGMGVTGVLAGGAAAATLAAMTLLHGQRRDTGIAADPRVWGRLLAYSVPLVGSGLASFVLGSADRWVLAATVDPAQLGQYALAVRFALIVAMLMQPFDLWWYARRMAVLEQPDGLARTARIVRLGMGAIAVSAAGTAAFTPALIGLLTPADYAPAMAMVPWLVLALAVQMLSSLVNVGCYVGRTTGMPLVINAAAAAIALALYAVLIPRIGVSGAIAATVVAQVARLVMFTLAAQRRVPIDLPYAATAVLTLAAAATGAVPQLTSPGWGSVVLCAAAVTATAGLAAALTIRARR